jgi:hypothetical protein
VNIDHGFGFNSKKVQRISGIDLAFDFRPSHGFVSVLAASHSCNLLQKGLKVNKE